MTKRVSTRSAVRLLGSLWDGVCEERDKPYAIEIACTHVIRWYRFHDFLKVLLHSEPDTVQKNGKQYVLLPPPPRFFVHKTLLARFEEALSGCVTLSEVQRAVFDTFRVCIVSEVYTASSHPNAIPDPEVLYLIKDHDLYLACLREHYDDDVGVKLAAPKPAPAPVIGYEGF